jgi:drug/metabolite transporter (DMT)-like permease
MLAGLVAGMSAIAIYAGMFAVGRHGAMHGLNGFDQTAIRFAVSAVIVLPFAYRCGRDAVARLGARRLATLFVLGGAPYSVVFLGGLVFAPVAFGAALVPGLQPVAVMAVMRVWSGQRPDPARALGAGICLAGLLTMLIGAKGSSGPELWIGIALFLVAAALWGSYAAALKMWAVDPTEVLATTAPLSALVYLPAYLVWRGLGPIETAPLDALMIQAVYQGLFVGVIALVLYALAVKIAGSTTISSIAPAMPLLATTIALVFLDERPGIAQWIGLGIVTLGLFVSVGWPLLRDRMRLVPDAAK